MTKSIEEIKKIARDLGIPLKEISKGRYEMISKRGGIMRGSKDDVERYLIIQSHLKKMKKSK
jgi:hypothetical protein